MAGLSNIIEEFLMELIEASHDGIIEIQRNEMAQHFECAPSQINYVLSTRFTPYKGYYIESRRGGNGYIKIVKTAIEENDQLMELINDSIGDSITKNKAYHIIEGFLQEGLITKREEGIIRAALSDRSLARAGKEKNQLRADLLKSVLLILSH